MAQQEKGKAARLRERCVWHVRLRRLHFVQNLHAIVVATNEVHGPLLVVELRSLQLLVQFLHLLVVLLDVSILVLAKCVASLTLESEARLLGRKHNNYDASISSFTIGCHVKPCKLALPEQAS